MAYCIGLTGHIASGKSTVAQCFSELGIDVFSADTMAKDLTTPESPAFQEILTHFGPTILTPKGTLDRKRLRQLILQDLNERLWLEALLHPLIQAQIKASTTTSTSPYCVIEIPLLTDRTPYPYLNEILLVQADTEHQIQRCMARDHSTREEILAFLALQTEKKPNFKPDHVLINKGSLKQLQTAVMRLHLTYLSRCRDS